MIVILFTMRCDQELQCYDQWKQFLWPIHWSWYKTLQKSRKLIAGQSECHTTGCLLDYDYIKNYYRATAAYLSKQKESDADWKAIHHIEFVAQLKETDNNGNATDAGADQAMYVLTFLGKIKKTRIKFSHWSVKVLHKMANYNGKGFSSALSSKQYWDYQVFQLWTCNHGHNILRLFDVLQNFPFPTSGRKI